MRRTDTTLGDRESSAAAPRSVATLRLLYSAGTTGEGPPIRLREGRNEIGRGVEPPGVLLDDPHASRLHASISVHAAERRAELSNESRRGTELEGAAVEGAPLLEGQLVTMGRTHALFRWEAGASPPDCPLAGVLGSAPALRRIRMLVGRLAPTDAAVLLLGETGTGKEVVARAIHESSGRAGPFVPVNCAAIPEALAESQLFGHVQGAFTGASASAEGFFRAAAGGTLLLDEIGDLPHAVQAKLLRALETGAVAPLGSTREVPHRARVITATHRDLVEDVEAGRFRRDLYARITDFVIALPPLRERREDVLPLLAHAYGEGMPRLSAALAGALLLHPWPFNVRELVRLAAQLRIRAPEDAAELALALVEESLSRSRRLTPASERSLLEGRSPASDSSAGASGASASGVSAPKPTDRAELEALLRAHSGVVADVARAVGRSRKQVYRWIREFDLDPSDFRAPE